MTIRDQRQKEFAEEWIKMGCNGILYLAPRFGKIYTSINIMERINPKTVLIAYPDNKIKKSWMGDMEERGYNMEGITFTTHTSLHKYVNGIYDLVILDEIHLLSPNQLICVIDLQNNNKSILGLTGSMNKDTKRTLRSVLNLRIIVEYSMEQAIAEGIVPDYEIHIVTTPLDSRFPQRFQNKILTEKKRFDSLMYVINKQGEDSPDKSVFFLKLKLIEVLKGSLAKRNKTIELIKQFKDERLLVFCGLISIAEDLGIPAYHSNSKDKQLWDDFQEGRLDHMAVVKIGNSGITYKPLSRVIINHFDSNSENLVQKINRCMSMEYDNPEKKAVIYIVTSTEPIEIRWLKKALQEFDMEKVHGLP